MAYAGPHTPSLDCEDCRGVFMDEPPDLASGSAVRRSVGELFEAIEHLAGYSALRPRRMQWLGPRHGRRWWDRPHQSRRYHYAGSDVRTL